MERAVLNPGSAIFDLLPNLSVPQLLHLSNGDNNPVFKGHVPPPPVPMSPGSLISEAWLLSPL